jgi:hypothetical protein
MGLNGIQIWVYMIIWVYMYLRRMGMAGNVKARPLSGDSVRERRPGEMDGLCRELGRLLGWAASLRASWVKFRSAALSVRATTNASTT